MLACAEQHAWRCERTNQVQVTQRRRMKQRACKDGSKTESLQGWFKNRIMINYQKTSQEMRPPDMYIYIYKYIEHALAISHVAAYETTVERFSLSQYW